MGNLLIESWTKTRKWLGIYNYDQRKGEFRAPKLEHEEFDATMDYWRETSRLAGTEQTVDSTTWNDLDMDAIYDSLRFTCSSTGDEMLYAMLCDTDLPQETLA